MANEVVTAVESSATAMVNVIVNQISLRVYQDREDGDKASSESTNHEGDSYDFEIS